MANTPWVDRTSEEIMSHQVSGLQDGVKNIEQTLNMDTEAVVEYGLTLLADADGVYRIAEALAKRNWLTDPAPVIQQLVSTVWTTITEGFSIDHAGGAVLFTENKSGESYRASFTRVSSYENQSADGVAIGRSTKTGNIGTGAGNDHIAIGRGANTQVDSASAIHELIAIGSYAQARGAGSTAIGDSAKAFGLSSVVIGRYSDDYENIGCVAIGREVYPVGSYDVAIGHGAMAGNSGAGHGRYHVAIGRNANTLKNSASDFDNMVAIGNNATATLADDFILGNSNHHVKVPGDFTVTGTKNFEIPHPKPEKKDTHVIRHGCYEGPVPGGTIYRYEVEVINGHSEATLELPDYFIHLNKDVDVHVSPDRHFGRAYGYVENENLVVKADADGKYKVLVLGTRNDDHKSIQDWDIKGVERQAGESWTGGTGAIVEDIEVDENTRIKKIYSTPEGQITTKEDENLEAIYVDGEDGRERFTKEEIQGKKLKTDELISLARKRREDREAGQRRAKSDPSGDIS